MLSHKHQLPLEAVKLNHTVRELRCPGEFISSFLIVSNVANNCFVRQLATKENIKMTNGGSSESTSLENVIPEKREFESEMYLCLN